MPFAQERSVVRRPSSVVLAAALLLAGCGGGELPPCDAPERQARAARVDSLPAVLRDSIARVFLKRPRVQSVAIEQAGCHLRATVRLDSFATHRYASVQGVALVRALKKHVPGETRPLVEEPVSEVGPGIYDYVVNIERRGRQAATPTPGEREGAPWMRLTKPYHDPRIVVRQ